MKNQMLDELNNIEKKVIDLLPELIILLSPDGKILLINNKMTQSLVGKNINLVGKNILDYFPKEVAEHRIKMNNKAIKEKKPISFVDTRGDQWFEQTVIPIFDSNGKAIQILVTVKNVTKRKLSEKNLQDLLDNMDEGVFTFGTNGLFNFVNKVIEERSGLNKDNFFKLHVLDLVLPDYKEIANKKIIKLLNGAEIKPFKVGYLGKNKKKIFIEIRGRPISKNGNIIGGQCLTIDITEKEKTKEKLAEKTEYLNNVIDNITEIIFTINQDRIISLCNHSAEKCFGFKCQSLKNKSFSELGFIENHKEVTDFIEHVFLGKKRKLERVIIRDKTDSTSVLKPSVSIIKDSKDVISDIVFICKDITHDLSLNEQLLEGASYIIDTVDNTRLKQLLLGYINNGKNVLFIGRGPIEIEPYYSNSRYMNIQLFSSLKENAHPIIRNLDELRNSVFDFTKKYKKSIVAIDRIDYLLNKYSFIELYPILCEINDVIKKNQAILFIRINKNILSELEYFTLKEDYNSLPAKKLDEIYIDENLGTILQLIDTENRWNKIVNQNIIVKRLGISKLTAQRRITNLIDNGLLLSKTVGRTKQVYLTMKGKELVEIWAKQHDN